MFLYKCVFKVAKIYLKLISVPKLSEKQSALFNAWKEMNRVSIEHQIPFRCVTQWATHQTGKLFDTLGLKLVTPNLSESDSKTLDVLSAGPSESKPASTRKKIVRGKKSNEK